MKLRIISAIVAVVFLLSLVLAPVAFGRATRSLIKQDVTTGATVRFTTDTTIYSRRISFQADSANASVVYIGDSTLDATSTATLENTALGTLTANGGWTPSLSRYADERGEQYRLSDWYASGTTGDKVRVTYEVQVVP